MKKIRILGFVISMACILSLVGCSQGKEAAQKEPALSEDLKEEPKKEDSKEGEPQETASGNDGAKEERQENSGVDSAEGTQVSESLEGEIREVGEGCFTIAKAYVEQTEDGGYVYGVPSGDAPLEEVELVEVSYKKDTVFEKQTIWDGGARYETAEASMEALEKGTSVEMQGVYDENNVFCASKIRIIEVVLE